MINVIRWLSLYIAIVLSACGQVSEEKPTEPQGINDNTNPVQDQTAARRFGGISLNMPADVLVAHPKSNARREAYFGDLHVHTIESDDAQGKLDQER